MSSWGGPGRGGGAYPKDVDAALRQAVTTLKRRLAVARKLNDMSYAQRAALFQAIDALQEQAEEFMCAAPDYPKS